jgi:hypothetical protein
MEGHASACPGRAEARPSVPARFAVDIKQPSELTEATALIVLKLFRNLAADLGQYNGEWPQVHSHLEWQKAKNNNRRKPP